MNIRNFKSLLFSLLFLVGLSGYSQILSPDRIRNRIKERAKERTAQEVDNRVDRGVDKVLDGLFGTVDKGAKAATDAVKESASSDSNKEESNQEMSQEDAMGMLGGLLGGIGGGAEPQGSYDFDASYVMKMTSTSKDGPQNFEVKYRFTDGGEYFGSEILNMSTQAPQSMKGQFMIYDMANSTMFTFMEMNGQKQMMSIGMSNLEGHAEAKIDENIAETTYTKTGQTKSIAGYTCDGYMMKQDGKEYLVWISRGRVPVVSSYYTSMNKAMNSNKNGLQFDYSSNPEILKMMKEGRALLGMTMEEDGMKTEMEVVDIKSSDSFTFNTAGYGNMMDFNKIMQDAQKQQQEQNDN
ncbi:DUF4412 domain-containing protein [Jiulongibacter sediminis]|uniref:DUF4412 domain-containing protein n=1 Tax=Jiulongibacter sediminis TaxID=1605367 RepID=A0A0N8H9J5_9BACT|nr:DUF4412 domain-containing protein [Jiulongibacter sediminis]KPM47548.1 hypothetical protein AFM12_13680 [Jiulongibacter sediminis]TBX23342.1 hypothetical protein TK44_13690 [Jiulongibacter sediminis]